MAYCPRVRFLILVACLLSASQEALAAPFVPDDEYDLMGGLAAIHADEAYAMGLTGNGVRVAIFDGGIDPMHPEFSGRVESGLDIPTGGTGAIVYENHGTNVAGIVGAARDGVGMQGVAYQATLVPIAYPVDPTNNVETAVNTGTSGFDYARLQGVKIINNSWGTANGSFALYTPADRDRLYAEQALFIDAMKRYVDAGGLVVFAAGNEAQPSVEGEPG
jgi:subtilase-type serine protease